MSQPCAAGCVDPAFWPPGDRAMLGHRNADGQRPQVTELSGYVLETLREGSEYILYRGRRSDNAGPDPGAGALRTRSRPRQISGGSSMNIPSRTNSIRHGRCGRSRSRATTDARCSCCEDPGGDLLEGMLGRPLELTRFLRLAISLDGGAPPGPPAAASFTRTSSRRTCSSTPPAMSGSPASAWPPGCRANARRPRRRRSSPARLPTWRPSRPAA